MISSFTQLLLLLLFLLYHHREFPTSGLPLSAQLGWTNGRPKFWIVPLWKAAAKVTHGPGAKSGIFDGLTTTGVFPKNRGTPKWMVYNGKPYQNGWFGGTTIFGNTHLDLVEDMLWWATRCLHQLTYTSWKLPPKPPSDVPTPMASTIYLQHD